MTDKAIQISALYLLIGITCMVFLNRWILPMNVDDRQFVWLQTWICCLFIVLSSIFFYFLVKKFLRTKDLFLNQVITEKTVMQDELQAWYTQKSVFVMKLDRNGRVTYTNEAALHLLGYTSTELIHMNVMDLLQIFDPFADTMKAFIENRDSANARETSFHANFCCKNGTMVELQGSVIPFITREKMNGMMMLAQHPSEHHRTIDLMNEQAEILKTIVEGRDLNSIMAEIVDIIERNHPGLLCSILLLDEGTQQLRIGAAPSLPDKLNRMTDGLRIGPRVGSCGSAAFTRKTVIVEDMTKDSLWEEWIQVVYQLGLRSCWSTPIISSSGDVLGTFALYSEAVKRPSETEVEALESYSMLVAMAMDRAKAEEKFRQSERRYQTIAENVSDLISLCDLQGNITYVSPSYRKIMDPQSLQIVDLIHEEDWPNIKELFRTVMRERRSLTQEARIRNRIDGSYVWLEVQGNPVFNEDGDLEQILFISRDITEQKKYEKSLEQIAYYDPLTGLPNRRLLTLMVADQIEKVQNQDHSFGLLYIDCDRFKNLNESLGYEAGDRFLQLMAERMAQSVSQHDTVARVGEDGFMILVVDMGTDEDTWKAANKVINELRKPWDLIDETFFLTSSIGLVHYNGQTASELVQQAEIAVHQAKRSGKNNISVYQQQQKQPTIYNQFLLEKHLYGALERNEFEIWYQAQVNYLTAEVVGVEALLRWLHPQWGMIPPSDFIQLTEDTGLIVPIGEWVLRTACSQMMKWQATGMPSMHICVNISPRQLADPGFVEMVQRVLRETNLEPDRVYLEITEGMLLTKGPRTLEILEKLHESGVHISVDDFGTGYSSLSYIKSYPIDLIKIDRSFIQDIPEDRDDIAIVKAIIEMSKSLQISVLAEGTENAAQVNCLKELGCEVAQGFLYSKPMNAQRFLSSYGELVDKAKQANLKYHNSDSQSWKA